jgi:hypothetical protein
MGLGDMFTMNGATRKLLEKYKKIIVVCKKEYVKTVRQMYSDEPRISVYPLNNIGCLADLNDPIYDQHHRYTYKFTGYYDKKLFDKLSGYFFEKFYLQLGFHYKDKVKYEKLIRNHDLENKIYNQFKQCYGQKYIFTHDHRGYIPHYNPRTLVHIPKNAIPIFHPNINYYVPNESYYDLWEIKWNRQIYDNILHYCKIIENAEEIHVRDSCFSCLCHFLDLSKVKKKVLYTNLTRDLMIKYSDKFTEWTFVQI